MTAPFVLSPVLASRELLQARAQDALREAVLTGKLAPGERIVEAKAAEQLGLSRSTVRAAIKSLIQEGLMVQEPFKGAVVLPLNRRHGLMVLSLREALERLGATTTAEVATRAEIDELYGLLDDLLDSIGTSDAFAIYRKDMALHSRIVTLSRHDLLCAHYSSIQNQALLYLMHSATPHIGRAAVDAQHRPLLDAIRRRDKPTVEALVQQHFVVTRQSLARRFPPEAA